MTKYLALHSALLVFSLHLSVCVLGAIKTLKGGFLPSSLFGKVLSVLLSLVKGRGEKPTQRTTIGAKRRCERRSLQRLSRATGHNTCQNGKFDFSVEPLGPHRNRPDTQKLNVSQDLVPSGYWIFGTVQMVLRSGDSRFWTKWSLDWEQRSNGTASSKVHVQLRVSLLILTRR